MKKVLSVVLALAMVLAVASFAMAATVSYTGSVKAEYNSINGLNNGYNDTYFTVDYTKDFQNGWSAGAQVKVFAGQTAEQLDAVTNDDLDSLLESDAVNFTGKGFVKYTADMWDIALQTG
ncbi:MAG TPA: porin, partial [Bacillota bacterium]